MYIQEAVKRAVEEDRYITTADFLGDAKIKPTDEKGMESSSVVFDEDSITLRAPKINLESDTCSQKP